MKIQVLDAQGKKTTDLEINDSVFGIKPNKQAMFDSVIAYNSSLRQGTHKTKTRAEVSGGGRKPWRQKGTGRARAGSNRSPIWVGGGVTFGPKPDRNYTKHVNKKVRKLALRSALSVRAQANQLFVLDNVKFEKPSTKAFITLLTGLELNNKKTLLITETKNVNAMKSGANIQRIAVLDCNHVNVSHILNYPNIIITVAAIKRFGEALK